MDTDSIKPNFDAPEVEFESLRIDDIDTTAYPEHLIRVVRNPHFDGIGTIKNAKSISQVLDIAWQTTSFDLSTAIYRWHLDTHKSELQSGDVIQCLVDFLESMPSLVVHLCRLGPWSDLEPFIHQRLQASTLALVSALIRSANKMGHMVVEYLRSILHQTTYFSLEDIQTIFELVALTVSDPEVAMDILLQALEPLSTRLLLSTPLQTEYLLRQLTGVVLDHIESSIDEMKANKQRSTYSWKFDSPLQESDKGLMLMCRLRLDAPSTTKLAKGDHVKFTSIGQPTNIISTESWTFEALVEASQGGDITFRCIRRPPAFFQKCWWSVDKCSSFVTSKSMLEAVVTLMSKKQLCCNIFGSLFPSSAPSTNGVKGKTSAYENRSDLNTSQNKAIETALEAPLTLIWGPPGTGKTHTIVALCQELLSQNEGIRLLVTAPTHSAVDNVMRQYIKRSTEGKFRPLRVSTDVSDLPPGLREFH